MLDCQKKAHAKYQKKSCRSIYVSAEIKITLERLAQDFNLPQTKIIEKALDLLSAQAPVGYRG